MDVSAQSDSKKKLKYFIMKSNNSTNIDRSLASGVWSTQHHNEAKLNNAFLDGYEIRLIFSVNQSGHFQGYVQHCPTNPVRAWPGRRYAVMKSAIGKGPKQNIWVGSAWGGFFEVDWQLQHDFPFSRFEQLTNPLNEGANRVIGRLTAINVGKPVKFARDGQEVPPDVGSKIVRIMQDIARATGLKKPEIPNQLRVEPYPFHSLQEGRHLSADSRSAGFGKDRGRGYKWRDPRYSGYRSQCRSPTGYPYAEWNGWPYYKSPDPSGHQRTLDAGSFASSGYKRLRSPGMLLGVDQPRKRSLYDMTYAEYLESYEKVQQRVREVVHSGELWKALGMIPEDYQWTEEDQIRIMESGWFETWFGELATGTSNPVVDDAESTTGQRSITETE